MRWPVIDTHFHLGVNPLIHFTVEELVQWMDGGGVDIQMIFQVNEGFVHQTPVWNPYIGNDFIARVQTEMPKRILGLGTVNPWHQLPPRRLIRNDKVRLLTRNPVLEELDRAIGELGLWGLKMHPLETHYQFNNPRIIFPIMERLTGLQRQVGRKLAIIIHAAGDTLNNSPEAIADTARRFPDLLFIAAHSGYKWGAPTVVHTMAAEPNVILDLTTMAAAGCMIDAYREYGPRNSVQAQTGLLLPTAARMQSFAVSRVVTRRRSNSFKAETLPDTSA